MTTFKLSSNLTVTPRTPQAWLMSVASFPTRINFFDNVDLGLLNIGEKVTVELMCDQPNHRFVVRLFPPSQGTVTEQFMAYTVSDSIPAVAQYRMISANVFRANCLGIRTSADPDVAVTTVMTN